MSEQWRAQYSSERDAKGDPVEVARPNTGTSAPAPAEPVVKIGNQRHITTVDENGNTTFRTVQRTQYRPEAPAAVQGVKVVGPQGSAISLDQAGPNDVVRIPALGPESQGDTSVAAAVTMGLLRKTANGYEVVGSAATALVADPAKPVEQKPAADADGEISMEGVHGTSAGADLVKGQIQRAAGEQVYNGLIQSYIRGSDPTALVQEIARRSGRSEADVRESTDGVFGEYQRSAQQIAAANGVPARAFESMVAWASEHAPDAALDAFTRLVDTHDAAGVARLAKQFARTGRLDVAYAHADLMNADLGEGVRVFEKNGETWLDLKGVGQMSFERAIREGKITVRGGGR